MGHRFARLDAWESELVERSLPAGPPSRPLLVVSRLADGSRLWFGIAAAVALRPALRPAATDGVAALLLAAGATQVVQRVVGRPRPAPRPALVRRPGSPSFPSSHTAVAVAFTTAVARRRPGVAAALTPLAATLAYGRIRLRVHWPTDVLGGAVLGLAAGRAASSGRAVRCPGVRGRRRRMMVARRLPPSLTSPASPHCHSFG